MSKRDLLIAAGSALVGALVAAAIYESREGALDVAEMESGASRKLHDGRSAQTSHRDTSSQTSKGVEPASRTKESAGERLRGDVRRLSNRLEKVEGDRTELEKRLAEAKEKLAALESGEEPRLRNEFDLDTEDWKALAETGTVKYRLPCPREGWRPNQEHMDALGLAPDDADVLAKAHENSQDRVWKTLGPLCSDIVGDAETADLLGTNTCIHLVLNKGLRPDGGGEEAMREVSEIRAGLRPMPGVDDELHPVVDMFLTLTEEMQHFEEELTATFGPEDAQRIAWSDELCKNTSVFGGPGPRPED